MLPRQIPLKFLAAAILSSILNTPTSADPHMLFSPEISFGNPDVLVLVASRCGGVPKNAFNTCLSLAQKGEVDSQYFLGVMYSQGHGVMMDYFAAVSWFTKAAEQGHPAAQFQLGYRYANGIGVSKDDLLSASWYLKAAENGLADAQNNLGVAYMTGRGVPRDVEEAMRLYRKAAAQSHSQAEFNLGLIFTNGIGVTQSYAEGRSWFSMAANHGHLAAREAVKSMATPVDLVSTNKPAPLDYSFVVDGEWRCFSGYRKVGNRCISALTEPTAAPINNSNIARLGTVFEYIDDPRPFSKLKKNDLCREMKYARKKQLNSYSKYIEELFVRNLTEKDCSVKWGKIFLGLAAAAGAYAIIKEGGLGGGSAGNGYTSSAGTDYSYSWDEQNASYGGREWVCRGEQTGQYSELWHCSGRYKIDSRWPG